MTVKMSGLGAKNVPLPRSIRITRLWRHLMIGIVGGTHLPPPRLDNTEITCEGRGSLAIADLVRFISLLSGILLQRLARRMSEALATASSSPVGSVLPLVC